MCWDGHVHDPKEQNYRPLYSYGSSKGDDVHLHVHVVLHAIYPKKILKMAGNDQPF